MFAALLVATPLGRTVALTFDDLPAAGTGNPELDPSLSTAGIRAINERMIAALKRHHAPAVAFVNERGISGSPDAEERRRILRRWIDAGMELGNHTYSHADLTALDAGEFERDIERGERSIKPLERAAGREPAFFRFPFNHTGDTDGKRAQVAAFLKQRGYRLAVCTIENEDYVFDPAWRSMVQANDQQAMRKLLRDYLEYTSTEIDYYAALHRQLFGREIPQVMLLHANRLNARAIEGILALFERKGYRFVTLSEAQADAAYSTPEGRATRFGPMWGYRWADGLGIKVDGGKEKDAPAWVARYRAP